MPNFKTARFQTSEITWNKQTDKQTDRQTDRQRKLLCRLSHMLVDGMGGHGSHVGDGDEVIKQ